MGSMQAAHDMPRASLKRQSTTYNAAQQRAAMTALSQMKSDRRHWWQRWFKPSDKWKKFMERRTIKMTKYESYSADVEESKIHFEMRALRTYHDRMAIMIATKCLILSIGITLACIAAGMAFGSAQLHKAMGQAAQASFNAGNPIAAGFAYVGLRLTCILVASLLALWQPTASGSGLPQIKANLNGADIPGFLTFRTLVAKTIGITLVVSTGFPLGKEGPMVHIGAIVAAVLSRLEVGPLRDMLELRRPAELACLCPLAGANVICQPLNVCHLIAVERKAPALAPAAKDALHAQCRPAPCV